MIAILSAIMILLGGALVLKPKQRSVPQPWEMGALEVELEEEMFNRDLDLEDEDYTIENESDSQIDNFDPVDYDEIQQISPSNEIVDELLGVEEEVDLDDLNDIADDFDLDDLDDLAGELTQDADDIDTSFIDDIL